MPRTQLPPNDLRLVLFIIQIVEASIAPKNMDYCLAGSE